MAKFPRNGQWVKFDEPVVTIGDHVAPLSEHFTDVCKTDDGKIVGIFSQRRLDPNGQPVPAQIAPVSQPKGENLGAVNPATSLRETMAFVEQKALDVARKAGSPMIVVGWPAWEDLEGLVPVEDPAELPEARQTREGFVPGQ